MTAFPSGLDRVWSQFGAEGLVAQTRVYRGLLGLWFVAFYLPRIPHAGELISRPVLRDPTMWWRWLGDPVLPTWIAQAVMVAIVVASFCFACGMQARRWHWIVALGHGFLFLQDQTNPRAYGTLSLIMIWLMILAPYDSSRERNSLAGTRLIKLQFASLYGFAVLGKIMGRGGGWLDGQVIDRILRAPSFGDHLLSEWYVDHLAGHAWAMRGLAWSTLLIEALVALTLWTRRGWWIGSAAVVALHLGLALSMRVSVLFHALMIAHLPLFVPDRTWSRLGVRLRWGARALGIRGRTEQATRAG